MADYTFYVKVANSKFVLDSVSQATIALGHGITYRFDQSDSSNSGHPLVFSTTSDGTHNSGSAYTTGVSTPVGLSPGQSGYYIDIAVTSSTPASLYYYCSNHSGMGSAVITTGNTHVTTNNLGLLLPILADATDQWGSHINQSLRKLEDTFGANADVYTYNITGDTTAITGSATAGGTLAFNDGQHIEVYLNGVKLVGNLSSGNDYTLNASTDTITLASNAVNGDVVNVVVFKTFQFADAVPATGGTFSGNVSFGDNTKAQFGAGSDLQIYHDGSNSYVDDAGTGRLYLRGNDRVQIQKYTGEDMVTASADDGVKLYHDNAKKIETTSTGINVSGNVVIADGGTIGSASDTDAITIDSSGNVLVGKTVTSQNTAGAQISATTGVRATVDGNVATILNRTSSDGTIADFRKDGTSVGTIGTANSGDLYIGNDDTSLLFAGGSDAILPRGTAGATRDASIDLGLSAHRFKDLYLSGGIEFGGPVNSGGTVSSSNLLGDYEEGTWTPVLTDGTNDATMSSSSNYGAYVKIGTSVFLTMRVQASSISGVSGDAILKNLPFFGGTSSQRPSFQFSFAVFSIPSGSTQCFGEGPTTGSTITLRKWGTGGSAVPLQISEISTNAFGMSGHYITS